MTIANKPLTKLFAAAFAGAVAASGAAAQHIRLEGNDTFKLYNLCDREGDDVFSIQIRLKYTADRLPEKTSDKMKLMDEVLGVMKQAWGRASALHSFPDNPEITFNNGRMMLEADAEIDTKLAKINERLGTDIWHAGILWDYKHFKQPVCTGRHVS